MVSLMYVELPLKKPRNCFVKKLLGGSMVTPPPRNNKVDLDEIDIYSWEDSYGTDTVFWSEEHQLTLPYWVNYMPIEERNRYIAHIRKHRDFD